MAEEDNHDGEKNCYFCNGWTVIWVRCLSVYRLSKSHHTSSNVPYPIIRIGKLENSPGENQGFNFSVGAAAKGSISKEDAARICVEALSVIPPTGLIFEVSNGAEAVPDWEGQLMKVMQI